MQIFLKVKDLVKYKEDVATRLDEYRKEYETLAINIKTKSKLLFKKYFRRKYIYQFTFIYLDIQHISLQHKQKTLRSRINILNFKSVALRKQIIQEENNKKLIIATMPVCLTVKNASEVIAMDEVKQALRDLDDFYTLYINQGSSRKLMKY